MRLIKLTSFQDGAVSHSINVDLEASTLLDLRYQLFSLTDIAPEDIVLYHNGVKIEPNDEKDAIKTLSNAEISPSCDLKYSDRRLNSTNRSESQNKTTTEPAAVAKVDEDFIDSVTKSLEACTGLFLSTASSSSSIAQVTDPKTKNFIERVTKYQQSILKYESESQQEKALKYIPIEELRRKSNERQQNDKRYKTKDLAFAKELLHWYKNDFFHWVDSPKCWSCDKQSKHVGVVAPNETELKYDASRTEIFACDCGATIRFPRYNDAIKLLDTQRGRCGEWTQVFTLMARACGLVTRLVYDWTDHVWNEIYCEEEQRWVHADCCEDCLDEPLLYESGWGKKLNYCVAVGKDCVIDVTRKYTEKYEEVSKRRTEADEKQLQFGLSDFNKRIVSGLSNEEAQIAKRRYQQELNSSYNMTTKPESSSQLPGRQSGSEAWVRARGEDGSKEGKQ